MEQVCNCRNDYFCCHSGLHKYIVLYKRIKSGLSLPEKGNPGIGGWGMNRADKWDSPLISPFSWLGNCQFITFYNIKQTLIIPYKYLNKAIHKHFKNSKWWEIEKHHTFYYINYLHMIEEFVIDLLKMRH